jgi:hypothetical protein
VFASAWLAYHPISMCIVAERPQPLFLIWHQLFLSKYWYLSLHYEVSFRCLVLVVALIRLSARYDKERDLLVLPVWSVHQNARWSGAHRWTSEHLDHHVPM